MNDRRRGLGRGLGALIPSVRNDESARPATVGSDALDRGSPRDDGSGSGGRFVEPGSTDLQGLVDGGARFAELDPARITANARQPRQVFDEDAHDEMVRSVREVGVLQPVVVRRTPGPGNPQYELVMGERRWRAAQAAGLPTIPAIIRETADDVMLRDALLENLHRAQLNPLEEAAAYDQLLQDFGCTQDELAERIGRSRPQISNTIRLLKLPPSVQRRLAAGVLSAGHARALLGLPDAAGQERLAQRIVAEGLSVRTVEEIVAVGETPNEPAPARPRRPVAPALIDLAARLSQRFETRVKVELGKRRGRITVEFGSIDDLERIVAMMDPAPEQAGSQPSYGAAAESAPATAEPASDAPSTDPAGSGNQADHPHAEASRWVAVGPGDAAVDAGFAEGSGADRSDPTQAYRWQ